jgi:hypothetical protein
MPSTYSTSLGIELIGNGEQAGTWGTTTNNNLGTLLEQAIAGVEGITLTGDYTLTDFNGISDESRNAVLVFNGSLGAPCNVVAPSVSKTYIVRNVSGATVTVKTSTGNGVAISNAASAVIFCDSTNFFSATTLNLIDGNLTVTGNLTSNNGTITNSLSSNTLAVTSVFTTPEINERTTITGTGIGGSLNFDTLTQTVFFSTGNATSNCTLNIRGNSGTTLNSLLGVGQSTCVAVFMTNGATPFFINALTIDGAAGTPRYQGGTAPTSGNPNSVDVYTFNIIKTASATYSVFASQTRFA